MLLLLISKKYQLKDKNKMPRRKSLRSNKLSSNKRKRIMERNLFQNSKSGKSSNKSHF